MSIFSIINPWGALREAREAREEIDNYALALGAAQRQRDALTDDLARERKRAAEYRDALLRREADVRGLRADLAEAHFRNPKTGRLGRKGETFE